MGIRSGNYNLKPGSDAEKIISNYAREGQISCRGRKLAANDLGISKSRLDELLRDYNIERAPMRRGRS